MTAAVLYARFSPRPNAAECDSVEKQLARCRAYCQGHDYAIVAEHADEDLSGGRADNRPGLQAALADSRKHKAVLVIYKLDRLARNTRDALEIVEDLGKSGADLASITEHLATRSPQGKLLFTILAAFAELERSQIQQRTSAAMLNYQAGGRRMTREDRCPFGKRVDPGQPDLLTDHAEELETIEAMKALRAAGLGMKAIATHLEAAGHRCRGKHWYAGTVKRILARVS